MNYPTTKNFITSLTTGELLGNWAYDRHHVAATAYTLVDGMVVAVTKDFTSRNAGLNMSQAVRWILQTAA